MLLMEQSGSTSRCESGGYRRWARGRRGGVVAVIVRVLDGGW